MFSGSSSKFTLFFFAMRSMSLLERWYCCVASSQRSDSGNTLGRKMGDILKEMLITTQRKERQVTRHSETLSTGGKQGPEAQMSVGGVRSGAGWGRLSACCEEAVMQVCSPDVEQHQHERADDDSLEDLPVAT